MGRNIKDPEVHAMARELAARRSTTVTDAVQQALRAELERSPSPEGPEALEVRKAVIRARRARRRERAAEMNRAAAAARAAVLHLSAASRLKPGLVAESARHGVEDVEVEQLLLGWRRYGKGRHRAGLNLGDCFSYGLAWAPEAPLLFKSSDFAATDVLRALPS
jgi:ribonuclease VapC